MPKFVQTSASQSVRLRVADETEGVPPGKGSPSFRRKSLRSHAALSTAYQFSHEANAHDRFFMGHVFSSSLGGDLPFKAFVDNLIVAVTET